MPRAKSRAMFLVIESRGRWWVDLEGTAKGPFDTMDLAIAEAKYLAQLQTHSGRSAEVVAPEAPGGRHRVIWQADSDYVGSDRTHAAE